MTKFFRKGKVKKVVAIVFGLVSVAGAVFGVSALAKSAKDDQKTISPRFSVGGLTDTGVYEETDDMIYTKDAFEAKGLQVKLDFDSNVMYQVFFYDELDKFISCTEVYTDTQDIIVPLDARARLEVTPIWGPDAPLEKEIKWYETSKYASQLEIRVDKCQELLESDFTRYKLVELFDYQDKMNFSKITKELIANTEFETYSYNCTEEELMYLKLENYYYDPTVTLTLYVVSADGTLTIVPGSEIMSMDCKNYVKLFPGDTVHLVHYYGTTTTKRIDGNAFVYFIN